MENDGELSMQIERDILEDLVNWAVRKVGQELTQVLMDAEITMEETGQMMGTQPGWEFRGPGFVKRLKEAVVAEVERKLSIVRFRQ